MEEHYKDLFPLARTMTRRFVFHAGPTNSGKTHAALEALISAGDGVYAAPLRLLALEGYDRLSDALPDRSAMRTGEEEIGAEDATHISCTIEMLPVDRPLSVAVIDEIQMIADRERGGAWTRAVIGAAAREVHLVGGAEALPVVEALVAMTGDTLDVVRYARKCPLLPLDETVADESALEAGDAVIAFSRRAVLALRARLIKAGIPVAVVYGDLSPEVRRKEAERFRKGEAKVLVATDTVGMGLNLPIRRVLFSETERFDGVRTRPLPRTSVIQISGRAGRYGIHEAGFFGTFRQGKEDHAAFIAAHGEASSGPALITQAVLEPDPEHVRAFWLDDDPEEGQDDLYSSVLGFLEHYKKPVFIGTTRYWDDNLYSWGDADFVCSLINAPVRFSRGHWDPARAHELYDEFTNGESISTPLFALSRIKNSQDLTEAESYQHAATLYFWLAKRWPADFPDVDIVRETRDRVAGLMADVLGSRDILSRSCSTCGRDLDPDFPYGKCAGCFSPRYSAWNYAEDSTYDDDDEDFEEIWEEIRQKEERDQAEAAKLGPLAGIRRVAKAIGVRQKLLQSWVNQGLVAPSTAGLSVKAGWTRADIDKLKGEVLALRQECPYTKKEANKRRAQEAEPWHSTGNPEAAEALGIPVRLLKTWIRLGLVSSSRRHKNAKNIWSPEDLEKVRVRIPELLSAYPFGDVGRLEDQ